MSDPLIGAGAGVGVDPEDALGPARDELVEHASDVAPEELPRVLEAVDEADPADVAEQRAELPDDPDADYDAG